MPTDLSGKLDFTQEYFSGNWPAYRSLEEQVLFPQLVDWTQTYSSAVEQLITEHQAIEDLAHNLPKADAPNLQEAFDELSQALVKHIRFEERIFFEEVQAKATPEEMAVLEKRIATFLSEWSHCYPNFALSSPDNPNRWRIKHLVLKKYALT